MSADGVVPVSGTERGHDPVACCRCGRVVAKETAREVLLDAFPEGRIYGWECSEAETCPRLLVGMGDDTYDPGCARRRGHGGLCSPDPCPACDGSGLLTSGALEDDGHFHRDGCPICGAYV